MLAPPPSFSNDSIGEIAEQVVQFSFYRKQIIKNQQTKKRVEINISELLNMEVLDKIRQAFLNNKDDSGQESLPADEFIEVLSQYLPKTEIERIYQKIDVNDDGNVDWQEFTGFLTTVNSNDNSTSKIYNKIFTLKLEQEFDDTNHKDMIDFICFSSKPIPVLATAGRDGQILIWNQSDLRRIGSIIHHDKNEVFINNMMSKLSIHQKAMVAKSATVNPITSTKKNVLITSLTMMPLSGHVCVSSGDCCVSLYDLSTQEICGRITSLTQIPTTLESFVIIDKIKEICNQYLVIGDSKGHIYILQFDSEFGMSVDAGSKKKNQILMNEAVKHMQTAKPHQDWISSMIYVPDLSRLVIASMDGTISLFNNQNLHVDRVFSGHKVGVRCVAWCNSNKFLLSAGTDRVILIWDPYTLRINVTIDGLSGLIISLTVNDRFHEIIAVLEDKTIRTWDAVTFEPISTIIDTSFQLPTNIITSALFVPSLNSLYTAGSRISCWQPDRATETLTNSSDDDLLSVLYNPVFNLILIITRSGIVNTFKLLDGSVIIKFSIVTETTKLPMIPKIDEKSGQLLPLVTHAIFDYSYRRLIIVTKESTEIQIWNFHNGQCLKVIHPRLPTSLYQIPHHAPPTYKPYSLTNILYQHIYFGPLRLPKKYIIFGTDIGVTSCLQEMGDDIDEEPIYNLILPDRTGKRYELNNNNNININSDSNNNSNNNEIKFSKSIEWIIPSSENKVLIRYKNLDVVQWDLEKSTAGVELCRRANEIGESFIALRRRVIAPRTKSIVAYQEKNNTNGNGNNKDLNDDNNLPMIQETISPPNSPNNNNNNGNNNNNNGNNSNDNDSKSSVPLLNIPNSKKTTIKFNGKRTTALQETKDNISSSNINQQYDLKQQNQRGSVLRSSFSYRNSRIIKPSMMQNFMIPTNEDGSIMIRESVAPAAVVGVARSTFRRASLNPLEEANESSLTDFSSSQSITRSFPRRSTTRVSLLQPNKPVEPRLTESLYLDPSLVSELQPEVIEENNETIQTKETKETKDIEKTINTNSSMKTLNSDISSIKNSMIRINAAVVLNMSKVAIGSCSDDLIRLWDLENGRVLCSCPSIPNQNIVTDTAESQNQLTCLCTNDKQDILVGGYETGEVKVWLISNASILNFKNSQQQDGLTVPPLQLLAEWTAHVAATFTVECITLDEEDWGTHETYLVTSGHDQESHLWTTSGLLVGTFGVSSWDLNLKNTWKMKPSDTTHSSQEMSKIVQNATPPPPHSPRKSKQKTPRHNKYQISTTPSLEDNQRAVRLQLHMEKITEKHSKPHVSVTSIHNEVFSESTVRHPIIDITKKGYISKKLKAAIIQNSHMISPMIPLQRDK